jgi:hypothetical protein
MNFASLRAVVRRDHRVVRAVRVFERFRVSAVKRAGSHVRSMPARRGEAGAGDTGRIARVHARRTRP